MTPRTIQEATETLMRSLHTSDAAVNKIRERLTQHLADVAILLVADNGLAAKLRDELVTHLQIIDETPAVIAELRYREAQAIKQEIFDNLQDARQESDQKFFDLLDLITAAGTATPAELLLLRKHAALSSNPARKYDIDRLTEALEDHDRQVSAAKGWNRDLPVFSFALEENGGQP
jgi:hypothetical protein